MAYVANTAFKPRFTNKVYDETVNIAGYFQDSGVDADCSAGTLCVRDTQRDNEGYTGIKNENTWNMVVATAISDEPLYACNTYDVNVITDPVTGCQYRIGTHTLGLPAPAGYGVAYTRIDFGKGLIYRFGAGNFTTAPDATKIYITVTNGFLVASSTAPSAGDKYFKVVQSGNYNPGPYSGFGYYDLEAAIY